MLKKLAVCMAAVICLTGGIFTGCSPSSEKVSANSDGLESAVAYKPEYISVEDYGINYIYDFCGSDENLIFASDKAIGMKKEVDLYTNETYEYEETAPALFKVDMGTKEIKELKVYDSKNIPEGYEGNRNIMGIGEGEEGTFWVHDSIYTYKYDLPEGFNYETGNMWEYYTEGDTFNTLTQFDFEGNELKSINLNEWGITEIGSIETDSKGFIYITGWNGEVWVYDKEGTLKFSISSEDNSYGSLYKMSDEKIGLITYSEDYTQRTFKVIDPATGGFSEEIELTNNVYNILGGFGEYKFCYDYNGKIYGYKEGAESGEKVLDWFEYDINSDEIYKYEILENGMVTGYSQHWDGEENTCELIIMNPVDKKDVVDKEEISLACLWMDYELKGEIIDFNKSNDKYRIVVRDYSEFNTEDDYNMGLTKLNTEIISGQVPDILFTNGIPFDVYASKGIMTDLWTLIEKDAEIKRSDLMEHVFDLMSKDGKLYQVASNFYISTAIANRQIVGDEDITVEKLIQMSENLPEGSYIFDEYITKMDVLSMIIYTNMDDLVDWESGECKFDSQGFIDMLNFVNSFPKEFDWENYDWNANYESEYTRLLKGTQILSRTSFYDINSYLSAESALKGNARYVGVPGLEGGITALELTGGLAISETCENKEAAWEFVRTVLTEEYQEDNLWNGFPTNKKVFDEMVKEAMTEDFDMEGIPMPKASWGFEDMEIEIFAMTQEQLDKFMDLINSASVIVNYDEALTEIILDEVEGFFDGQKSAEETANLIQSRVSLYVSEQR